MSASSGPDRRTPVRAAQRADGGAAEAADYISGAVATLAEIARRHRLDVLGFLLDMARLEADEVARVSPSVGPESGTNSKA